MKMKASRCFVSSPLLLMLLLLRPLGCLAQAQDEDFAVGCELVAAKPAPINIPPTWQASFPGSGSRMTRYLMEALTGIKAKNLDLFTPVSLGGRGRAKGNDSKFRVIGVKTHYPVNNLEGFEIVDHFFERALVIFRNPLHAFASLFNQNYERWHHLPTHTMRGPQRDWINWRDQLRGVPQQIERYENFVSYWMEKWPREERPDRLLLVSYEDLTDSWIGPAAAGSIAEFLGRIEGVTPVPPEGVPCVWNAVVNYKNQGGGGEEDGSATTTSEDDDMDQELMLTPDVDGGVLRRRLEVDPNSLRSGPKIRPYSFEELDEVAAMLQRLLAKYGDDEFFARTFSSYLDEVVKTPVEEGREIHVWG